MDENQVALEYARENLKAKIDKYGPDHPKTKRQKAIVKILEGKGGKKPVAQEKSKKSLVDKIKEATKKPSEDEDESVAVPSNITGSY